MILSRLLKIVPEAGTPVTGTVAEKVAAANANANKQNDIAKQIIGNVDTVNSEKALIKALNNTKAAASKGVDLTSPEVQAVIAKLKARDEEVKAHEQAHIAVGGRYITSGAQYDYQNGPDGKRYAVGGEVSIDTSPVENDPPATVVKGGIVYHAALAPVKPSSQDYSVASTAQQMIAEALLKMRDTNTQSQTDAQSQTNTQTQANTTSPKAVVYEQTDQTTNTTSGQVGGWQDLANRLGLSLQA